MICIKADDAQIDAQIGYKELRGINPEAWSSELRLMKSGAWALSLIFRASASAATLRAVSRLILTPLTNSISRQLHSMWATRYGHDYRTPNAMIPGPKVMLVNETAGSGGDFLPWLFRKSGLRKLIGKRTWGGLVGILGFPVLMDGGRVSAPNLGIWTEDGFIVENEGVPPDIEVEQWPAEVAAGHDPQLEKAIQVVMEELKANPPKKLVRPPFPVRVK